MTSLLLIPLDDTVVFPTMTVTLPVDVGDDERVLLVPRHEGEYATVGTVAKVARARPPARRRPRRAARGHCTAASPAPRTPIPPGACASRSRSAPTRCPPTAAPASSSASTAPWSRRSSSCAATTAASAPSCARSPSPARSPTPPATRRTSPSSRRSSCSRPSTWSSAWSWRSPAARAPGRAAGRASASARTSSPARPEAAARVLPAPPDGRRSARSSARTRRPSAEEYRTKIAEAGMPDDGARAGRARARPARAHGRADARGSMIRTYLDWLLAVPWSERSEERLDPPHAREVLDADHAGLDDVKERIVEYLAVRKLRAERGIEPTTAVGRHPDPDRPSRHRQDVDRRVDRPRHGPRSSCACRSAACATRPRSAAIAAPTSAPCPAGWCARCATPGR